eukprot:SAG31_NODE_31243_length_370_cov_0.952030_1_plen_77_part_10
MRTWEIQQGKSHKNRLSDSPYCGRAAAEHWRVGWSCAGGGWRRASESSEESSLSEESIAAALVAQSSISIGAVLPPR